MGYTTSIISRLPFVADPSSIDRNSGRQIDWDAIPDSSRETAQTTFTVTMDASALAAATSLTVVALPAFLPSGTVLDFGTNKYARTTANAEAGATSLAVAAIPTALAGTETATVVSTAYSGPKLLSAGTVVGDLAGGGKLRPRVVTTNPAIGILEVTAREDDPAAALTGYGVLIGGHFYENLLPDASGSPKVLATAIKTELNANGTGVSFEQYGDNR